MKATAARNILASILTNHSNIEPSISELMAENLLTHLLKEHPNPEEASEDEIIAFIECWRQT